MNAALLEIVINCNKKIALDTDHSNSDILISLSSGRDYIAVLFYSQNLIQSAFIQPLEDLTISFTKCVNQDQTAPTKAL